MRKALAFIALLVTYQGIAYDPDEAMCCTARTIT